MKIKDILLLFEARPCSDALNWLEGQPDMQTAWAVCDRGDWMWWALMNSGNVPEKRISVAFARACARRAKKHSGTYAAWDAWAAAYATYAAYATSADDAAYAAYAAAWAAGAAAVDDAERKWQATWIRKHVTCPFGEVEK